MVAAITDIRRKIMTKRITDTEKMDTYAKRYGFCPIAFSQVINLRSGNMRRGKPNSNNEQIRDQLKKDGIWIDEYDEVVVKEVRNLKNYLQYWLGGYHE